MLLACAGVEGGPWRHSFTQTFKLPSEIAPCNLLAQAQGTCPEEQILGQGIRKKQLLPVHAETRA